ncbi:hypothetical protein KQI52_07740 [bacterium]|nr:hypothetical protein [bacterium]
MAATHPELGKVVERTIVQFMRGWLHGVEKISVAFSPPWGNAWKIPVGELSGEDVREHVEWELQQRLKDSLHSNIFAWNRVNGEAYAVVIRPELLSFWEDLLRNRGLELSSVTITSGLVEQEIEEEADLLPLLHLWQSKDEPETNGIDHSIDVQLSTEESEDEDVLEADVDEDEEETVKLNADALSRHVSVDELDDVEFEPLTPSRERGFLPWMLGAVGVLVVVAVVFWFFRDPLLGLLQPQTDTAELAESVPEETEASAEITGDAEPAPTGTSAPSELMQQRAGYMLDRLFTQAFEQNVNLSGVILQGREVLFEASGDDATLSAWKAAAFSGLSLAPQPHESRGGSYQLDSVTLPDVPETQLTVTEFDMLATEAGLNATGAGLYTADRAALTSLFNRMAETGERPWRLSVHKIGTDAYHVLMMP